MRARHAVSLALLVAGVAATAAPPAGRPPARAEHAAAYRYTVLGYVTDAQNRGRRGVHLEVVREKTGYAYRDETDADGFYLIILRLGDESAGERLRLSAEAQTLTVTARFDPADHDTERGTRVDWNGGRPLESPSAFVDTLKRYLAK